MYNDFAPILIFSVLSVAFIVIALFLQKILAPSNKGDLKSSIYECGEEIEIDARAQFNIRFYVVALIFLIFDVEVVLLFPWAVVFKDLGLVAFIEMLIFLGILTIGLVAVWRRGDLDWVKMEIPYALGRYANLDQAGSHDSAVEPGRD
ncbi:MAG: NADH-quinone oxidoreductase subunit A [Candidatus Marinimicrobia bacterium]|nr:NADH-quinone oxidoreductase subunit A [Candidatus Neomarinimicrobiota bacterium]